MKNVCMLVKETLMQMFCLLARKVLQKHRASCSAYALLSHVPYCYFQPAVLEESGFAGGNVGLLKCTVHPELKLSEGNEGHWCDLSREMSPSVNLINDAVREKY